MGGDHAKHIHSKHKHFRAGCLSSWRNLLHRCRQRGTRCRGSASGDPVLPRVSASHAQGIADIKNDTDTTKAPPLCGVFFLRLMSAIGRKQTLAGVFSPQIRPSGSFLASECPLTTQSGHSGFKSNSPLNGYFPESQTRFRILKRQWWAAVPGLYVACNQFVYKDRIYCLQEQSPRVRGVSRYGQ